MFGRGPGVDLIVAAGRGLSRRAGLVTAMAAGAWIANISRTHALYVEGDGYQVRLPRMEHDGEPANGWFVHTGTALVGSRAMLDDGPVAGRDGHRPVRGGGTRAGGVKGAELAGAGLAGAGLGGAGARRSRAGASRTGRSRSRLEPGSARAGAGAGAGPAEPER